MRTIRGTLAWLAAVGMVLCGTGCGDPTFSTETLFAAGMLWCQIAANAADRAVANGGGGHTRAGGLLTRTGHGHAFGGGRRIRMGGGCGGRGHKSLEDGDPAGLTRPAGCPKTVLPHEAPTRAARLFVYCEWDTPADMELMVLEPGKEMCGLANELTKNGGMLDWDLESPTGPQTYTCGAEPPPGQYAIGVCRFKGEGKVTATLVVQQNARMEGWSAKRYKITLPAPGEKPVVQPVAVVDLK